MKSLFVTRSNNGTVSISNALVEAVLDGARHDGYAAEFLRDEDGFMWFCSSDKHFGGNTHVVTLNDSWSNTLTSIENDDLAKQQIAEKIKGDCHMCLDVWVEKIVIDDNNNIVSIEDKPIHCVVEDWEMTQEEIKKEYQIE